MLALMAPIVDAVAYLHRNRLTHLDIKPQNIMLATADDGSMRPVLIDFGLSKHYDANGNATSTVNTLACSDGYSPVEQYSGITTFSPSSDVYALGATMLACLIGKTPQKSTEWPAGERMRYIDTLPVSEPLRAPTPVPWPPPLEVPPAQWKGGILPPAKPQATLAQWKGGILPPAKRKPLSATTTTPPALWAPTRPPRMWMNSKTLRRVRSAAP